MTSATDELLDGVAGYVHTAYVLTLLRRSEQGTDQDDVYRNLADLHLRYTIATKRFTELEDQFASAADLNLQKSVVSTIGSAINARAGISKVPTEIIGVIMASLRTQWPPSLTCPKGTTQDSNSDDGSVVDTESMTLDLAWINVTHVSKLWRTAGVEFGDLWSDIDTDVLGPRWSAELLARSRRTLLDLKHRYALQPSVDHGLLPSLMPRTRSLEITSFRAPGQFDPANDVVLTALESSQAPYLEELVLRAKEDDSENPSFFEIPAVLFNSSATRLRSLVLENILPCLTSPLFSTRNIRSLSISFVNPYDDSRDELQEAVDMSPNQLLAALSVLAPGLEDLTLVNCLPLMDKWKEVAGQGAVALPSLKTLKIHCDSLDTLFAFIGYLTVVGTIDQFDIEVDSLDDSANTRSDAWINGMYARLLATIRSFCFPSPGSDVGAYKALHAFNSLAIKLIPDPRFTGDYGSTVGAQPFLCLQLTSIPEASARHPPSLISISMPLDLPMTCPIITLRLLEMIPISWVKLDSLTLTCSAMGYDGRPDRALWDIDQAQVLVERLGGSLSKLTALCCGSGFSWAILNVLRSSDPAVVFPQLRSLTAEDDIELYLKPNSSKWLSDPRPHWPRAGSDGSGLGSLFGTIYDALKARETHVPKICYMHLVTWIEPEDMVGPNDGEDAEMREVVQVRGVREDWDKVFDTLEQEIEDLVEYIDFSFWEFQA